MLTSDKRQNIALLRYRIIGPLIGRLDLDGISKASFFKDASKKTYLDDNHVEFTVSEHTLKRWYYNYQQKGLDGLVPERRVDSGTYRKIDDDIFEQIRYLKSEYPKISAKIIYDKLAENGTINKKEISLSTINRCVNKIKLNNDAPINKDRKRYEREHINEVWAADTLYGPYITVAGKKVRTYVIAVQDDASRMIVGCNIYFNDNFENVMDVIKSSVKKYGKPKVFNLDNGSSYKNKQIELVSARLGATISFAPPYTPQSKGKIERFFLTLRKQWLALLKIDKNTTIEDLSISLVNYINSYNQSVHSSLNGLCPIDRFFKESDLIIRVKDSVIDTMFLIEIERRVSADNVIKLNNKEYEVPSKYCKQKIVLRYSSDLKQVYIVKNDNTLEPIELLNKIDNSKIKRKKVSLVGN